TSCIGLRSFQVRQIPAVFDARLTEHSACCFGIAHSMDCDASLPHSARRCDQKFLELAGTLFVSPVPYPDDVGILLARQRPEMSGVGCLLKYPDLADSEQLGVNAPDRLAEGQNAVELLQGHARDLFGIRIGTVMGVMEQRAKAQLGLEGEKCIYDFWIIPLMNDHHIRSAQLFFSVIQENFAASEEADIECRKGLSKIAKGLRCLFNPL